MCTDLCLAKNSSSQVSRFHVETKISENMQCKYQRLLNTQCCIGLWHPLAFDKNQGIRGTGYTP